MEIKGREEFRRDVSYGAEDTTDRSEDRQVVWKSQEATRVAFERCTGRPFPSARPTWLQGLELDGYNVDLGIAFEYNGKQHYEFVKAYHASLRELQKQHERDIRKNYLCALQGVILVTVPYTTPTPGITKFVAYALKQIQSRRPTGPRLMTTEPVRLNTTEPVRPCRRGPRAVVHNIPRGPVNTLNDLFGDV